MSVASLFIVHVTGFCAEGPHKGLPVVPPTLPSPRNGTCARVQEGTLVHTAEYLFMSTTPRSASAKKKGATPLSAASDSIGVADGTISLAVSDEATGPAASAILHWESLRQLGACLSDVLLVSSRDGHEVALSAWASPRVPPGRVAFATEVRAALGARERSDLSSPGGAGRTTVRARLAQSGDSVLEARVVDLCALDLAQAEEIEAAGLHEGARLHYLSSQLLGWPLAEGCVLPLRLHGRPMQLRVARALPVDEGMPSATAARRAVVGCRGGSSSRILKVSARTRWRCRRPPI